MKEVEITRDRALLKQVRQGERGSRVVREGEKRREKGIGVDRGKEREAAEVRGVKGEREQVERVNSAECAQHRLAERKVTFSLRGLP